MKDLVWCAVAQAFARSVVELIDSIIDIVLADLEEAGVLWKVLAQQAIGVLVESTLAGAVRMREVHLGLQKLANEFMLCKLLAVVKSQRLAKGPARAFRVEAMTQRSESLVPLGGNRSTLKGS